MRVVSAFWWVVGSIVLMVVGAFGPWAKILGLVTVAGTDGGSDGWIIVSAAAVAAVALGAFVRWPRRWLLVFPILAGAAGAATAGYDLNNIESLGPSVPLFGSDNLADAGWGIYLALVSSTSLALAAIALWVESSRRARNNVVSEMASPDVAS